MVWNIHLGYNLLNPVNSLKMPLRYFCYSRAGHFWKQYLNISLLNLNFLWISKRHFHKCVVLFLPSFRDVKHLFDHILVILLTRNNRMDAMKANKMAALAEEQEQLILAIDEEKIHLSDLEREIRR